MKRIWKMALLFAWVATGALAETSTTGQSTAGVTQPSPTTFYGKIDVRPSISANGADTFFTENSVEAGFKFGKKYTLSYLQGINTNLSGTRDGKSQIFADIGFLRGRINNLYVSDDETMKLGYQGRIYTPTSASGRAAGFVTANRHYFTLSKKYSDTFSLYASQVTVFYLYNKAGTPSGGAHKVFENRLYLIGDLNLGKGFSLSLPLFFHQARHRNYVAGAKNNNDWSLFLWTWPELLYSVNDTYTVGISYYSNNLLEEGGLAKGVGQLTFQASI